MNRCGLRHSSCSGCSGRKPALLLLPWAFPAAPAALAREGLRWGVRAAEPRGVLSWEGSQG